MSDRDPADAAASPSEVWLSRFTRFVALSTLVLICAGGLVTSTGSALAVPDWPLSFGQVFPKMAGGVLYEHGHRLIAATVGFLIIIQAVWLSRVERRASVRRAGWLALAVVIAQGVLGGITVLFLLPTPVSVAHAGLAELFFALTVGLALVTSAGWRRRVEPAVTGPEASGYRTIAALTAATIYVQILLGALVRHTGSGLAIPDFPLAYGHLIPPVFTTQIAIHYAHRVGAVAVLAVAAWSIARARRVDPDGRLGLRAPSHLMAALLVVQIALAWATLASHRAVVPTTAHVVVGASIWATSVILAMRARHRLPALAATPSPVVARRATA